MKIKFTNVGREKKDKIYNIHGVWIVALFFLLIFLLVFDLERLYEYVL